MPQMMPINWLMLFMLFIMIFILFNIMNYYMFYFIPNKNENIKNLKFKNLNWKW